MNNNQPVPQNGDRPLSCGEFAEWEAVHREHSARMWRKLLWVDATVKLLVGLGVATFVAVLFM